MTASSDSSKQSNASQNMLPPRGETGIYLWLRKNLFATPTDTVLTIACLYILYLFVPGLVQWGIIDAIWSASGRVDCWEQMEEPNSAACWAFVSTRLQLLTYGFYPEEYIWRVNVSFILFMLALVPILWENTPRRPLALLYSALFPFIATWLIFGGLGLEAVETKKIGGIALTLLIGVTGIAFSLPIGIMLALGRTSKLPVLKMLSVIFIEFIRGVPLIALLFIASTMLNYFLPPGTTFDLLVRVLIMVTFFASAYMAEVIRGGLAGIPKGQIEAAQASGLSYWKTTYLIVMPQVLKISIPGIVNTFIGLFKDTTLVLIIGMFDVLGMGRSSLADPNWNGLAREIYIFVAIFFFICCFGMSYYSAYLERKLDTENKF